MNDPEAVDDLLKDLPEWSLTEEIADLMRVKAQTVLKWTREYGLKSVSIGQRVRRYRKKDVRDFLLRSDEAGDEAGDESGD
ncbi:helix-turn-helix domain-containing protein [Glutamicibacter arilaitensis]|uniref:helix-turn-helix domain-containing protein n=1 Tax=Glutamicibacter arilaitensis TaxID=256701 RepID=UPI003FD39B60